MRMLLFSMIFPITDGFEPFSPWPKISSFCLRSSGFALEPTSLGIPGSCCTCFPFPGCWLLEAGSPFFSSLDGSLLGGRILASFMVIPLVVLLESGLLGSSSLVEAGLSVFSGLSCMVELEAGMSGSCSFFPSSMLLLEASAVDFTSPSSFFGSFGTRSLSVSPSNSILTRLMSPSSGTLKAAKDNAAKAYNPDPHGVCNNVNKQANRNWPRTGNTTRRGLGKVSVDSCLAANPIDRCWRCDKNWAKNRQKLADCVLGFGHKTTGGKKGPIYEVVDDSDHDLLNPKPGTLRHAVIQDGPLWITFKHGMVIKLSEELLVSSNKTIDGRGGQVHIAGGAGIMLQFVDNVIIHSVHIHDIKSGHGGLIRDSVNHYGLRTASDGDGISIFGSTNIWIDHVSMSNCMDGLIDAIEASTAITISNCHFTDHNDVMLFGARDGSSQDEIMQVTIAYNHFGKRLIQRMPRCRYGFFHVLNNDYTHWEMYAIGGSQHPTIISQGNRFIAPPNIFAKEVTKREYAPYSVWKDWLWTSDDDIMQNGAFFNQSGDHKKKFSYTRQDMIKAKPGSYVKRLTRFAGALNCKEDKEC